MTDVSGYVFDFGYNALDDEAIALMRVLRAMGEDVEGYAFRMEKGAVDPNKIKARAAELGISYDPTLAKKMQEAREPPPPPPVIHCAFCTRIIDPGGPIVAAGPMGEGRLTLIPGIDPISCIACARLRGLPPFNAKPKSKAKKARR